MILFLNYDADCAFVLHYHLSTRLVPVGPESPEISSKTQCTVRGRETFPWIALTSAKFTECLRDDMQICLKVWYE